jgi:Domain of unknown function (DUF4328)
MIFLVGAVAYNRGEVARSFDAGDASFADLRDADDAFGGIVVLAVVVWVAVLVVLCLWSHRTVRNARQRDPQLDVSPGLAAGGWFIPLGNVFVPWAQLRRSARRYGAALGALGWWQGLAIGVGALSVVARIVGNFQIEDSVDDVVGKAHGQGIVLLLAGLLSIAATIVAMRAMKQIDAANAGG